MKKFILQSHPNKVNKVFVWHIVTPVAEMLFMGAPFAFEYYEILEDGSANKWLKSLQEIQDAISNGNEIGIEVDWIPIKPLIDVEYNKKLAKMVWDDIHNNDI